MSKKRFIICIKESNPDQEQEFISYVKENKIGWWHWLPNFWLLSTENAEINAIELRRICRRIFNDAHFVVIELNDSGDTWAGFGPSSQIEAQKNMFNWIKKNWKA